MVVTSSSRSQTSASARTAPPPTRVKHAEGYCQHITAVQNRQMPAPQRRDLHSKDMQSWITSSAPPARPEMPHLSWLVDNIRHTGTWRDNRFDVVPLLLNQMLAESSRIPFNRLVIMDNQGALTHFSDGPPDLSNAVVLRLDNAHYDAVRPRDPSRGFQPTQRNGRWWLTPEAVAVTPITRDGLCLTNSLAAAIGMNGDRLRADFCQWLSCHEGASLFEEKLAIASMSCDVAADGETAAVDRAQTRPRTPIMPARETVPALTAQSMPPLTPAAQATSIAAPQLAAITAHLTAIVRERRSSEFLASLIATTALPAAQQHEIALSLLPALVQQMATADARRHPGVANVAAVSYMLDVIANTQASAAKPDNAQLASLLFNPLPNARSVAETLAPWLPFPDITLMGEHLLYLTRSLVPYKPAHAALKTSIEKMRKQLKAQAVGDEKFKQTLLDALKAAEKAIKKGKTDGSHWPPPVLPSSDALPRLIAAGEAHLQHEARQKQALQKWQITVSSPAYQQQERIFAKLKAEAEEKKLRDQQRSQAMIAHSLSKARETDQLAQARKTAKQAAEAAQVRARKVGETRDNQHRQAALTAERAQAAATVQQMQALEAAKRARAQQLALSQPANTQPLALSQRENAGPQAAIDPSKSGKSLTTPSPSSGLVPYDARATLGVAVKTVTGRYIPAQLTLSGQQVVIEADTARAAPGIHTFSQMTNTSAARSEMWLHGSDSRSVKISGELGSVALHTRAGSVNLRAKAWQGNTPMLASDSGVIRTRLDQETTEINARDMNFFRQQRELKNARWEQEGRERVLRSAQIAASYDAQRNESKRFNAAPRRFAEQIVTATPVFEGTAQQPERDTRSQPALAQHTMPESPVRPASGQANAFSPSPSPEVSVFKPLTLDELLTRSETPLASRAQP